jgi:hypothetical protein
MSESVSVQASTQEMTCTTVICNYIYRSYFRNKLCMYINICVNIVISTKCKLHIQIADL